MGDVSWILPLVDLLEFPHRLGLVERDHAWENIPFFGTRVFGFEEYYAGDLDSIVEAAGTGCGCVN